MADHDHHDHCGCGCESDDDMEDVGGEAKVEDEVGKVVDLTADGGVKKKIIKAGTGAQKPPKGADVTVHYVGTLTDGTGFDSSRERGEPFTFKLGCGQVIKGWDTGVATMRKGELSLLTCTAPYAYGDAGSPPKIPGGATLNFEVELISWVDEKDVSAAKDGSIMKKVLKDGEGWEQPSDEATVNVAYVARLRAGDKKEVERNDSLSFAVGEEQAPIPALDQVVTGMKKGEKCLLVVAPKQAYGEKGCEAKGVPANAALEVELTLNEFKKPKMVYEMSGAELLEGAEKKRLEGNELYKAGKVARALRRYKKAIEFLEADYKFSDEEKKKAKPAKVPCYLNIAACKIATKEWKEAAEQCGKALEIDSANVRALTRRGKALTAMDDWDSAERDFVKALEVDAKNADALREKAILDKKRAAADNKLKQHLHGMFSRMAKLEEEDEKKAKEEAEKAKKEAEEQAKKDAEEKAKKEAEEKAKKEAAPAAATAPAAAAPTAAAAPAAGAADVEMKSAQ